MVAMDLSEPFTIAQARAAGISRHQLQGSAYQRLMHGIYLPAGPVDLLQRVSAAWMVLPGDAVVTGRTALRLRGFDLGGDLPLSVVSRERVRVRRPGIDLTVVPELPARHGRIATTPAACAFILDNEPLVDAVTVIDRVLQRRMTAPTELLTAPLTPRARAAYAQVDAGSQSPPESVLRLALTQAGLPRPETQGRVMVGNSVVAQVDLLYRKHRVAIEYEGGQHLTDPGQWNKDIDRYAGLTRIDYAVVRVTAARMRSPDAVVMEVYAGLADHGYRGPVPVFSADWWMAFGQG